ncbi:MAG: oppA [Pedosphaera sp.]|nr:oppA [Pedosphaera sp.]
MNFSTSLPLLRWRGVRLVNRARRGFFLLLFSACLLGAGCVRHEPPADLVILNGVEPESLDPAIITGQADMRVVISLFEGLMRLDPKKAEPIPAMAERWEVSSDGRIYTFHLRSNLVWSTGEPITADDVVYSWIRALNPDTASDYAGQLFYLKNAEDYNSGKLKDPALVGVHALDARTVRVELNNPTAFFLDLCAFPTLAVVPRKTIEQYGDQWIKARPLPVSGAYELVDWRLSDKIRVRKNPRYWDAANTKSTVIDFLPIGSATTALNLYETGGADIAWDKELVPVDLLDVLLKRPDFHSFPVLGTYFVRMNVTRKPFDDPRVREALNLAVDKARLTRKITKAGEPPADHFVPSGIAKYHSPKGAAYNPEKARQLLAAAGYPGGRGFPHFQYMFNASAGGAANTHAKVAVELQQMWHDTLGIEMELHQVEWSVYLAAQSKLDYDMCRASWIGDYNDADTFLNMFTSNNGNNRTGWKSDRYDELIRQADMTTDPAQREKTFQEAEALLIREGPILPIFFYVGLNYYNDAKIKGIYNNILDMHPVNYIWKEKPSPATGH